MLMNMKEFVFSNWLQNIQMHLSKKPKATSKQKKKNATILQCAMMKLNIICWSNSLLKYLN